jgi:lysyl-tRNA synthetase class I
MNLNKALYLANKFAEETLPGPEMGIENFADKFDRKFSALLNEFGGDILVLRHKKLDKKTYKELIAL